MKKYTHITADKSQVKGSRLISNFSAPYTLLIKLFGKPHLTGDGADTDVEWQFLTPDGVVFIYNYKNGPVYKKRKGAKSVTILDVKEWSIGARSPKAGRWIICLVEAALNVYNK